MRTITPGETRTFVHVCQPFSSGKHGASGSTHKNQTNTPQNTRTQHNQTQTRNCSNPPLSSCRSKPRTKRNQTLLPRCPPSPRTRYPRTFWSLIETCVPKEFISPPKEVATTSHPPTGTRMPPFDRRPRPNKKKKLPVYLLHASRDTCTDQETHDSYSSSQTHMEPRRTNLLLKHQDTRATGIPSVYLSAYCISAYPSSCYHKKTQSL